METTKAIAIRRSTRAFKLEQIKDDELEKILTAGKLAPIAHCAYQNVHFTIIQNKDLIDEISHIAQIVSNGKQITANYGAPTLVVVSGKPFQDEEAGADFANTGCVIQNMLLTATDIGIGSVYTWTINFAKSDPALMVKLAIPEGFFPLSTVALGYPVEPIEGEKEPRPMSVNYIR
jgi:nitroreductase